MGSAGGALKGAAGGAATGAVLGPWGAAAGGIIGGALGYFGSDDTAKYNPDISMRNYDQASTQLGQISQNAQLRRAPQFGGAQLGQAYQLAPGQIDQSRQGIYDTANRLGQIAGGQQAGAGEMAVNRQVDAATAAQIAAARGVRGAGSALALRNAARTNADLGLQGAGQAAQAQMQDQQAANQQLGQLYGMARQGDIEVAGQNAQLGQQRMLQQGAFNQQAGIANQQASLQQQQLNDAAQLQALGQMLGWDQARINAELAKAGLPTTPGLGTSLMAQGGQALASYAAGGGFGRQSAPAAAKPVEVSAGSNGLINPYA